MWCCATIAEKSVVHVVLYLHRDGLGGSFQLDCVGWPWNMHYHSIDDFAALQLLRSSSMLIEHCHRLGVCIFTCTAECTVSSTMSQRDAEPAGVQGCLPMFPLNGISNGEPLEGLEADDRAPWHVTEPSV
jgi:hypothetical protein